MVTIIPNRVEKMWEAWNARGAILLSFFIQMFLVLFAPLRKRSDDKLVEFAIWSAYLLSDWTANFSVGLITSNNGNSNDAATKDNLLALWAPFLLLHFGGPDAITAFNLEDNQLWLRQIPGLLFKVVALAYVFVVTLPHNALWAPTLLIFVAGIIKYSERTYTLYVASNKILWEQPKMTMSSIEREHLRILAKIRAHAEGIRMSYLFKKADIEESPGHDGLVEESPGHDGLVEESPGHDGLVDESPGHDGLVDESPGHDGHVEESRGHDGHVEERPGHDGLVEEHFIDMKPLKFELKEYYQKKKFGKLADKSHIEALEVTEVLCDFIYQMYYTKASILRNKIACLVRFVAFSSVVVALGLFTSLENNGSYKFDKVDVVLTYALFYGALFIETISLFRIIFSEWMVSISNGSSHNNSNLPHVIKFYQNKVLKPILILQRPRWSPCKKRPYTHFKELSTPFLFRKWCGSISGLNLIAICLDKCYPKKQSLHFKLLEFLEGGFDRIAPYFGAAELQLLKYKVKSSFFLDMWQFILDDLKIMMPTSSEQSTLEQRIRLALDKRDSLSEHTKHLVHSFLEFDYGQNCTFEHILILWHVTTDICYAEDKHNVGDEGTNKRHFIKILSNYMLYLLLMQPKMMSEVIGIEQRLFQETFLNATRFFVVSNPDSIHPESIDETIWDCLHSRVTGLEIIQEDTLFFHACRLGRQLNDQFSGKQDVKWEVIGTVWVQILSFVAVKCRPSIHVQQLSKGGGLISLVWLASLLLRVERE